MLPFQRVAQAELPPPLLLLNEQGDWEAHAKDESEEELAEGDNVLLWTLGYPTDRFPETTDALREGTSRRAIFRRRQRDVSWEWNGSRYVRIEG